jgi:DNA-directed RNA polymerase subunit M
MNFCDDCGSMMKTATVEGESVWRCPECGAVEARGESGEFVTTEKQRTDDVIETSEDLNFEGKPTSEDVRCEECGTEEAWYTIKQTGSADEPPTRFFKCTECGHRWREYS